MTERWDLIPEDYQNGLLAAIRDANEDIDFRRRPCRSYFRLLAEALRV
jgi:hypothetical protein